MNTPDFQEIPGAKELLERILTKPESFTYEEILELFSTGNCLSYQVLKEDPELARQLLSNKTPYWKDFIYLVAPGIIRPACQIWVYVDGAKTYADPVYWEFLKRIIKKYHNFDTNTQTHIEDFSSEWLELTDLNEVATDTCKVESVRIRYAYCDNASPFQSAMTREQRKESESKIVNMFAWLNWELEWTYESLETMTPERREQLIDDHILSWTEKDEDLVHGWLTWDWPVGRWVFLNNSKELFFLVNDEDNRVGVLQKWGDIAKTFTLLGEVNSHINENIDVARLPWYGKLASCPTNIGTWMRASALVCLPNMAKQDATLKEIAKQLGLSIRGFYGENSKIGPRWETDVSNKARLGISERQIIENVHAWVSILMELENKIANNPEMTDEIIAEFLANPIDLTKKKINKVLELKTKSTDNQEKMEEFQNWIWKVWFINEEELVLDNEESERKVA